MKITKSKKQRGKKKKKMNRASGTHGIITKKSNIYVIRVSVKKEKEDWAEKVLEETLLKTSQICQET